MWSDSFERGANRNVVGIFCPLVRIGAIGYSLFPIKLLQSLPWLWQYGLWSFQTGGTKLERFLPKNQHTQRKLLNFEDWINGDFRRFQKSEF